MAGLVQAANRDDSSHSPILITNPEIIPSSLGRKCIKLKYCLITNNLLAFPCWLLLTALVTFAVTYIDSDPIIAMLTYVSAFSVSTLYSLGTLIASGSDLFDFSTFERCMNRNSFSKFLLFKSCLPVIGGIKY